MPNVSRPRWIGGGKRWRVQGRLGHLAQRRRGGAQRGRAHARQGPHGAGGRDAVGGEDFRQRRRHLVAAERRNDRRVGAELNHPKVGRRLRRPVGVVEEAAEVRERPHGRAVEGHEVAVVPLVA